MYLNIAGIAVMIGLCIYMLWSHLTQPQPKIKRKRKNDELHPLLLLARLDKLVDAYYVLLGNIQQLKQDLLVYTGLSWFNAEAILKRTQHDVTAKRLWDEMRNYQREAQAVYEEILDLVDTYRECPARVMRGPAAVNHDAPHLGQIIGTLETTRLLHMVEDNDTPVY